MTVNSVTFTRPTHRRDSLASTSSIASTGTNGTFEGPEETIYFDYAVYALGSGMPDPVNVWSEHPNMPKGIVHDHYERGLGTKRGGIRWMQKKAEQLQNANRIVIVGGGALGIRMSWPSSVYLQDRIRDRSEKHISLESSHLTAFSRASDARLPHRHALCL